MLTTVVSSIFPIHHMMSQVMVQVTPLTQVAQVTEDIILLVSVHVRCCQHHHTAGFRMRQFIFCSAIWKLWTTLTCITGSLAN